MKYFLEVKLLWVKKFQRIKFNIKLIHDKDYYEDSKDDPYSSIVKGAAVQHITFEILIMTKNLL